MKQLERGREMKIDFCKLTEDLMPLYSEELVSQETKEFIEAHLKECSKCRDRFLTKDGQLPNIKAEIFEADQTLPDRRTDEAKYQSAKEFLLRFRKRMYGVGIVVLILMLLVSTGSFIYGQKYRNDEPIKVSSAEDFARKVVPGWERAERAGQIVDLDITESIPGSEATVTFEKVWYTPANTYVLYTVKEPNKKYLMATQNVIDISPVDYASNNQAYNPLPYQWGGVSSEGYHQVMVFMGYDTPVPAQELTLTASQWIIPKLPVKPEPVNTIEGKISVKLPLSDVFLKESSEIIPLEKTFEWKGRKLHLTGMEVKSSQTLLYGEVDLQEGETLNHLEGCFKSGEQSAWLNYESIVPGETPNSFKFIFSAEPLNEWPSKVSLEIRAIHFRTSKLLNIPVEWSLYVDQKGRIIVPERQDTTVSFYDCFLKLNSIEPDNWIDIQVIEPSDMIHNKEPYITMSLDPLWVDPANNYATGLKITNENGEILQVDGTGGGHIFGNDKVGIGFGIDAGDELWKTSKNITITISKPEAWLVLNQEIEIIK